MVEAFDGDLAIAASAPDVPEAFLAGIWRTLDAPVFETGLELMVVARSDQALRTVWLDGTNQLSRVIDEHVAAVAKAVRPQDPEPLRTQLHLSVLLVQAFALDGVMGERRPLHRQLLQTWSKQVRAIAFEALPIVATKRSKAARSREGSWTSVLHPGTVTYFRNGGLADMS